MAENKIKNKNRKDNNVTLVGYIKEDNLNLIKDKNNQSVIRGSLTITTDEKGANSHKVQFWTSETTKKGEHSKDFDSLSELLPEKVVSVASYLEDNPGANFAEAAKAATKIWAFARFDEYVYRSGERVSSSITLKGSRAGLKKATDKTPFKPRAEFSIDVYLEDIRPEEDENESETGRTVVNGIYVDYRGIAQKYSFIAPEEDGIAGYINDHYTVGTTTNLKGDILNIVERKIDENAEDDHFGRGNGPQYKTTFVNERKIVGGSKTPLKEGEEGAYSKEIIKAALAAREVLMDENGKRRAARENGETYAPKVDFSSKTDDSSRTAPIGFGDSTSSSTSSSASSDPLDLDF